jgi:hypothetical protein
MESNDSEVGAPAEPNPIEEAGSEYNVPEETDRIL